MFRHALKSRAFSSLRIFPTVSRVKLGRNRWNTCSTTGNHHHEPTRISSQVNVTRRSTSTLSFPSDTIYALSSAPGRAGIAVIRISGPACADIYTSFCPSRPPLKPRHATLRTLYEPSTTNILDSSALLLSFPAPRTVTGEDVLELHIHGGPATVKAVLASIPKSLPPSSPGRPSKKIRYAEPGEFTRRAFLNDRLDLAQVEALSDALAAETEQQRRAAVRGASGALGRTYEVWRRELLLARAEIEALIDFSEDQHFDESPSELLGNVAAIVRRIVASIERHEVAGQRTELLRSGIRVALLGPPNAGKSSLMNLIVGREASIVSHEAGTTRDVVEAILDVRGYLCRFADTAGFRGAVRGEEKIGAVEEEGIRRARKQAEEADVVVVLASVEEGRIVYDPETLRLAQAAQRAVGVVNKRDAVADEKEFREMMSDFVARAGGGLEREPLTISCKLAAEEEQQGHRDKDKDPGGIQGLMDALAGAFGELTELPGDMQGLLGVTERQRQLLRECRTHLEEFLAEAGADGSGQGEREADVVLAAEYLRSAAGCLARITGKGDGGDVEEVLGVIFEKFCVGK